MGGLAPCRFRLAVPGLSTCSSRRLRLTARATVVAKLNRQGVPHMAESTNAAAQAQAQTPPQARAQFKPFAWNPLDGLVGDPLQRALFLNHARDVVDGAHTLLQL